MNNPYYAQVQQKLSHCQILLSITEGQVTPGRQEREALLQAAILHLAIALRLYLRELASNCEVGCPEQIYSLSDLEERIGSESLLNDIGNQIWLRELIAVERQLLYPATESESPVLIAGDSSGSACHKINYSLATVQDWLLQFQQMSERQRSSFVEY